MDKNDSVKSVSQLVDAAARKASRRSSKRVLIVISLIIVVLIGLMALLLSGPRTYTSGHPITLSPEEVQKDNPRLIVSDGELAVMRWITEYFQNTELETDARHNMVFVDDDALEAVMKENGMKGKAGCYISTENHGIIFSYYSFFRSYVVSWGLDSDLDAGEFLKSDDDRRGVFRQTRYHNFGNETFEKIVSKLNFEELFEPGYLIKPNHAGDKP